MDELSTSARRATSAVSMLDARDLVLDASGNLLFANDGGIWRFTPGAALPPTPALTFVVTGDATKISRAVGSFTTDGFAVGKVFTINGATKSANNGVFKVSAIAVDGLTMTVTRADGSAELVLASETATGVAFVLADGWTDLNTTCPTCSGLRIAEIHSLAYDPLNNDILIGGLQDNGTLPADDQRQRRPRLERQRLPSTRRSSATAPSPERAARRRRQHRPDRPDLQQHGRAC